MSILAWRLQMASLALQNSVACAQAAQAFSATTAADARLQEQYLDAADRWMVQVIVALGGKTPQDGDLS